LYLKGHNDKLTSGGKMAATFWEVAEYVDGTTFQTAPLLAV